MLVVGEEDVPAVGPAETPIEGGDKVLASGVAGLVCKRRVGGARTICEGGRGVAELADVEIGLVDKEGVCLDGEGLPGCLTWLPGCSTWDRGTVTCVNKEDIEDVVTEENSMKVALVVAGKFPDKGVIFLVDANGGDISEEAIMASTPSLLEKIGWWVVGERSTRAAEDNRVSRGRPGEVLWAWSLEGVTGEVFNDNRDEGEVSSLKIGTPVAACVLVR